MSIAEPDVKVQRRSLPHRLRDFQLVGVDTLYVHLRSWHSNSIQNGQQEGEVRWQEMSSYKGHQEVQ
jgi:hypothetical protein